MSNGTWFTPPEIGKQLGIKPERVIAFIESRELLAANVATKQGRGCRPRWRISPEALAAFLDNRSSRSDAAPVKPQAARQPRRQHARKYF